MMSREEGMIRPRRRTFATRYLFLLCQPTGIGGAFRAGCP